MAATTSASAYLGGEVAFRSGDVYEMKRILGEGGFGIVFLGQLSSQNEEGPLPVRMVAMKTDIVEEDYQDTVGAEASRLEVLAHPYIIKLIDSGGRATGSAANLYAQEFIAIENAEGGSIWTYIKVVKPEGLPAHEALLYTRQMTSAINYMHVNGWVHKDVKLMNVLLVRDQDTKEYVAKISDLGGTRRGDGPCLLHKGWGTPKYAPPEMKRMRKGSGVVTDFTVDVWALGICLFEMVMGAAYAFKFEDYGKAYKRRHKDMTEEKKMTESEIGKFIVWVMNFFPRRRPTTYEMLLHPVFANIPNNPAPIIYPGLEDQLLADVGERKCPKEFRENRSPLKSLAEFARGLFVDVFGFMDFAAGEPQERETGLAKKARLAAATSAPYKTSGMSGELGDEMDEPIQIEPITIRDLPDEGPPEILRDAREFLTTIDTWTDIRTNIALFKVQDARDQGSVSYANDLAELSNTILRHLNL